ncbi:hypothetical protein F5Y15DRAFT_354772 [Xylariaceae sp. FL0016]|nr:hypothetical protein F5Y15DRAFT_354772 [Xylariaceae sp. FL0016]
MLPAVWDYIVVGGGLAGTVVSNRLLSYNSSLQILLIEAGPDVSGQSDILYYNSTDLVNGDYDWAYDSTPQEHFNGRTVNQPAGRCLSGGAAINGCAWYRGDRTDYNDWADLVGDSRWNYDNMLQYMKNSEHWFSAENADQHGQDGHIYVSSPLSENRTYPLSPDLVDSWTALGVPVHTEYDTNHGDNIGLGELNSNRQQGVRELTNVRYPLDGITVMTETMVQSVSIDSSSGSPVANGVLLANGTSYSANEVIVSGGSYRSPQLLMLSGIGPEETLNTYGIPVKLNAPQVGQNFADHFQFLMNWRLRDPSQGYAIGSSNPLFSQPQYSWGSHISYVTSTAAPKEGLAAAIAVDEGAPPDYSTNFILRNEQAMMENVVSYAAEPMSNVAIDGTHISTTMVALKPSSRGSITISSSRIEDVPIINPNYFATELDRYVWRVGLRNITELMTGNTTFGQNIIAGETPPDGFDPITVDSTDDYLNARIAAGAFGTYHPMGSCSMGKVVDADLRVMGVDGLRVVDASVIPIAIGAHTQAPVYALAEHAAAIISGQTASTASAAGANTVKTVSSTSNGTSAADSDLSSAASNPVKGTAGHQGHLKQHQKGGKKHRKCRS